jgi:hypothetical protein
MNDVKTIRLTKKLERALRRYSVSMREENTIVEHATYGRETDCDPITFAVFEGAIKSIYLANAPQRSEASERYHHWLAHRNGFRLPDPSSIPVGKRGAGRLRATEDYYFFASVLRKAGLYYALLD